MTPNGGGVAAASQPVWDDSAWVETAAFARRFGTQHSLLAMHAAVPIGLTPELVHLLRVNFAPRAQWIAEADLLLSPLSQEVGASLYLLEPGVRDLLQSELLESPDLGPQRLREVSTFLYAFTDRAIRSETDPELLRFLRAQQWAARASLDPDGTAEDLARELGRALGEGGPSGSGGIAGLIRSLAGPLFLESELLLYAAGVERLATGDAEGARTRLGLLTDLGIDVKVGDVQLPAPDSLMEAPGGREQRRRERPPRVSITYDVETGDAREERELPFVVGVLADLAGHASLPELPERRFVEITPDSFDQVLDKMEPRLRLAVENRLSEGEDSEGSVDELRVELAFRALDDFRPERVVTQVEPLAKLAAARRSLAGLREQLVRSGGSEDALRKALGDPELLSQLESEVSESAEAEDVEVPPVRGPSRIWLCSSAETLREHRSHVKQMVLREGAEVLEDDELPEAEAGQVLRGSTVAAPDGGRGTLKERMASCDLVLAVVGRSGDPTGADSTRSTVEEELDMAEALGVDTFVFLQNEGPEVREEKRDTFAAQSFALRAALLEERFPVRPFGDDPESLPVAAVIGEWREAHRPSEGSEALRDLGSQVLEGTSGSFEDTMRAVEERLVALDGICARQLDAILHHPDFQALEAAWRGVQFLLMQAEPGPLLEIRVMAAKKDELARDLGSASSVEGTHLFRTVIQEEWGRFGGTPYGLLVGAYDFDHSRSDTETLRALGRIGAQAHAPFVASASPRLLGVNSFAELRSDPSWMKSMESPEYDAWRKLQASEESRYLCLTLPRILLREPYRDHPLGPQDPPAGRDRGSEYTEAWSPGDGTLLWGNVAWALGGRITDAFAVFGWPARIFGFEGGGMVEGLPIGVLRGEASDVGVTVPSQMALDDRSVPELTRRGLMPLVYQEGSSVAVFTSAVTMHPTWGSGPNDRALADRQLPQLLCACRFAHAVSAMARDTIGAYRTGPELEKALNDWIAGYVRSGIPSSEAEGAKRPLAAARVTVREDRKVGMRRAILELEPVHHLEELAGIPLRMEVGLPEMMMPA